MGPATLLTYSAYVAALAAVIKGVVSPIERIVQHFLNYRIARNICDNEGAEGLDHLVPLVKAQRTRKKRLSLPRHGP